MTTLTYLFTCRFTDGSVIQQTPEDVSRLDASCSAFYDVLQRIDEVESFIIKKYDAPHTYMVDLRDGHFEIDGVPFFVSSEELPGEAKFRLIYFHRHQHNQGQSMMGDVSSIAYHIGWQTTIDGKNFRTMISVNAAQLGI
jgi:hypothetical protein